MGKKYITEGTYINPKRVKSAKAVPNDLIRKMMRHRTQLAAHTRAHIAMKTGSLLDAASASIVEQTDAMLRHGYQGLPTTKGIWYRNHARQIKENAEYMGEVIYDELMRRQADEYSATGTFTQGEHVPQPPRGTQNPTTFTFSGTTIPDYTEPGVQPDPRRQNLGNE